METTSTSLAIGEMKREDFLKLPCKPWNETRTYDSILIFPSKRKHDSGYAKMIVVGVKDSRAVEIVTDTSDDINWHFPPPSHKYDSQIRTDCYLKNGALHFWTRHGRIECGTTVSSIDITVVPL